MATTNIFMYEKQILRSTVNLTHCLCFPVYSNLVNCSFVKMFYEYHVLKEKFLLYLLFVILTSKQNKILTNFV